MNDENNKPATGTEAAETTIGQQTAKETETTSAKEQKGKNKGKAKSDSMPDAENGESVLHAVGASACKRHGLAQVWVTSDGQAFAQESDAKAHAANLKSKETIKVTAK
ncbi:MAG: hypothetical protein HUK14_04785 [Muribaculaceae bacterium]|nr:hypothetical protein [Muribaculaceae bacterium]